MNFPIAIDSMAEEFRKPATLTLTSGNVTIILFLIAQTVGGVWWAATITERLFNMQQSASTIETTHKSELESLRSDLKEAKGEIELLKTYNQRTREELAARHIIIGGGK